MYQWTRKELKTNGKTCMHRNYWKCVLTAFILALCGGISAGAGNGFANLGTAKKGFHSDFFSNVPDGMELGRFLTGGLLGLVIGIAIAASVVSIVISIFVLMPLEVNCRRIFIINRVENPELSNLGFSFSNGYGNVIKTQFLRALYIFLWSLLLIVPGIIKGYSYRMVPYILADKPADRFQRGLPPFPLHDGRTEMESICTGSVLPRLAYTQRIHLRPAGSVLYCPV